eukprot:CAMPEP_0175512992 /NCGR_PEP_ID=MMETSP0096-20121207/12688_1 /TAXON_ID=311494 /ORGANISM="Alexandrium monilatum, Strain CCMP3105" /LENGTH=36 /DNA_ID= /DNA_START= /DNA_END= /DNA_ORIENTATION=
MSAKGRMLAASGAPGKNSINPPTGALGIGVPATGEP